MSYEATRWAWDQPVKPAMTKLLLLAMADCVNAEGGEMVCWPSYAFLARRTGMNTKTVEASVYKLKTEGYLVDTGRRAGDTAKVVVYRLNTPENGVVKPGPQASSANGTRPQNNPETGFVNDSGNPPKFGANPPKLGEERPQKVESMTPKQGVRTRNGTSNGTRKEPGTSGCAFPLLADVPEQLLADWMKVRKGKHAGPVTQTVSEALIREAGKAGMSNADAVRYCCEAGWQNFNAGYHAKREGHTAHAAAPRRASTHAGFSGKNYREGVSDDGSFE